MSLSSVVIIITAVLTCLTEAQLNFDYLRQDEWGDFCNLPTSRRQTPINIVTADVEENSDLIPLEFDAGWDAAVDGIIQNVGTNLRFSANADETTPILRNHLGYYEHLQFHMHWGDQDSTGSGHQIDGNQFGLEFHWVNVKQNSNFSFATVSNESDVDVLFVFSLLAEANDSLPISGVWAKLDPTMVRNDGDMVAVTGIPYSDLLPQNRDYYYYPGSFTRPPCLEIVQWFVLKERIQVPSAYIAQLRTMLFNDNTTMLTNHRDPQPLNDRTVYSFSSGAMEQATASSSMVLLIYSITINYFL